MMKRAWKYGSHVVTVGLGIMMVVTIFFAVSSRLNGGVPNIFGKQMYEVLSGSMEPHIHTGSIILDSPKVNISQLKVGDVITFKLPKQANVFAQDTGAIVTHRIAQIVTQNGTEMFRTKGDANQSVDPWIIPSSNVIAKYTSVTIPFLGYYLNFLKTRLGIALLMILPGALLIISSVVSLIREIARLQKGNAPKTATSTAATVSVGDSAADTLQA